ncbi:MAG TPA: DUF6265 family protein [Casimicrobiaceae bacterium]|jgi:hypothetical protein|nr:DUF6265 family protein [Casimicrobiaceae bacterium]
MRRHAASARRAALLAVVALVAGCAATGEVKTPAAMAATPAPAPATASGPLAPLAPLAWLAGCWKGSVNERDFREMWLPLAGGTLIGAGRQVLRGEVQDYEFLRIEARGSDVVFTQFSGDRKEASFRLAGTTTDEDDTIFTFANTASGFPARLMYRRGSKGWLYETIEGTLNGAERRVIYPFRRVDCQTDALITE